MSHSDTHTDSHSLS